jgi:hypothetical protein
MPGGFASNWDEVYSELGVKPKKSCFGGFARLFGILLLVVIVAGALLWMWVR